MVPIFETQTCWLYYFAGWFARVCLHSASKNAAKICNLAPYKTMPSERTRQRWKMLGMSLNLSSLLFWLRESLFQSHRLPWVTLNPLFALSVYQLIVLCFNVYCKYKYYEVACEKHLCRGNKNTKLKWHTKMVSKNMNDYEMKQNRGYLLNSANKLTTRVKDWTISFWSKPNRPSLSEYQG